MFVCWGAVCGSSGTIAWEWLWLVFPFFFSFLFSFPLNYNEEHLPRHSCGLLITLFLGKDDWTILACMALLVPVNAFVELMTNNGLGTDNFTLSPRQITLFLKVSNGGSSSVYFTKDRRKEKKLS